MLSGINLPYQKDIQKILNNFKKGALNEVLSSLYLKKETRGLIHSFFYQLDRVAKVNSNFICGHPNFKHQDQAFKRFVHWGKQCLGSKNFPDPYIRMVCRLVRPEIEKIVKYQRSGRGKNFKKSL